MELSAAAGSGGEHSASGKRSPTGNPRRRSVKRSLEYPCVSRFRHRRLLAYLSARRFHDAFESLALETDVFFRVDHLQGLARSGRWVDAIKYIARFAPSNHILCEEGQLFVNFVYMHNAIDSIVAGESYGALVVQDHKRYLEENPNVPAGNVKLVRILLSLFNSRKLRASINWDLVRHKAADMLEDLIASVPEFNDLLRMLNCPTRPRNVLPIGFSSRPRRHVKGVDRLQASDLARFYLEKQKRLPSKDHCLETVSFGLSFQATARLADLLANLSTRISPAENSMISSEAIAGTKHPMRIEADHDFVPRHTPKRPRPTEHQVLYSRKRQITGEFTQHTSLSSQAYCLPGDERVGDAGSTIRSWSAKIGDCSSPPEI